MTSPLYPLSSVQIVIVLFLLIKGLSITTEFTQRRLILGILAIYLMFFSLLLVWDTSIFASIAKHIPMIALYRNPKKIVLSLYVAYIVTVLFIKPLVKPHFLDIRYWEFCY